MRRGPPGSLQIIISSHMQMYFLSHDESLFSHSHYIFEPYMQAENCDLGALEYASREGKPCFQSSELIMFNNLVAQKERPDGRPKLPTNRKLTNEMEAALFLYCRRMDEAGVSARLRWWISQLLSTCSIT